jgi:uncharacterized membrane protein YqjE
VPITLAIAAGFLVVFITVPISRLVNIIRRRVEIHVPLVTDTRGYQQVAEQVAAALTAHGMELQPATPGWSLTAPARILLRLGGPAFRDYVPARLAYFRGPRLEAALYPNALTLVGSSQDITWAHGLVVEALTTAPAYQTFDPAAQDIERQVRSVWAVFRENPSAHAGSAQLLARVDDIARDIGQLPVEYDEWQIVYRQALQLARALTGQAQLLEAQAGESKANQNGQEAEAMATNYVEGDWRRALSTGSLIREIIDGATGLARKEIELAKIEMRADFHRELAMAKTLGVAALLGLLGLNALVVALIIGLATFMPAWLSAIAVGVVFLAVGAGIGYWSWNRRVTDPLALTRKHLRQTAQWAKERIA